MDDLRNHPHLSKREQQLITLAAEGLTDTAIALRLGISEPTVKSYWARVRGKLGPFNRTELVANSLKEEAERAIAELNGEIDRLRNALEKTDGEALDLQRKMLASAPDAVLAVDQEGCIVWLNPEAERMFGYRFDEIVGLPISTLVPEGHQPNHKVHVREYFANPERKQMGEHLATVAIGKDGREFAIAASLAFFETPKGTVVTCFVRSVAERAALRTLVGLKETESRDS
jgi:PAS domain S-box-containing protein